MPSELLALDKLVHAIAFAIGSWLLGVALQKSSPLRGIRLLVSMTLGVALYGVFDEVHQLFTPGRSGADLYDWVADIIGGTFAAAVYGWWQARRFALS